MHEMALTCSLVDVIEDQARLHDFVRVRAVTVEIGCLGHVDGQALRFCFDVAARETVVEGAELIIVDAPGRVACLDCGAVTEVEQRAASCPECDSPRVLVDGSDRVKLTELEVD